MGQNNTKFLGILLAFIAALGLSLLVPEEPKTEKTDLGSKRTKRRQFKKKPKQVAKKTRKAKKAPRQESKVILNDPAFSQKWGLKGTDVKRAWNVSQGSRKVVVAVIDTGTDIRHEDLANNLWVNKGETGFDANGKDRSTNGIDDDGNGYIDDIHGWNFVGNNNRLTDNHGHGTLQFTTASM